MTNAERAHYYSQAAVYLRRSHIKGRLTDNEGGYCLVGALNEATKSKSGIFDYGYHNHHLSNELQEEVLGELFKQSPVINGMTLIGKVKKEDYTRVRSADKGLGLIELWNDLPWRRSSTVVKLLEELAADYGKLAQGDRVRELEAMILELRVEQTALKNRIAELEAENERLAQENGFLKGFARKRVAKVTAQELLDSSKELADLDSHLEDVYSTLVAERASV